MTSYGPSYGAINAAFILSFRTKACVHVSNFVSLNGFSVTCQLVYAVGASCCIIVRHLFTKSVSVVWLLSLRNSPGRRIGWPYSISAGVAPSSSLYIERNASSMKGSFSVQFSGSLAVRAVFKVR